MSFTSIPFYVFAALTVLLYYLLPRGAQWIILLTASLVFYTSYSIGLFPFIFFATLIAWLAARKMASVYDEAEAIIQETGDRSLRAAAKKRCRKDLTAAIVLILAALVFIKTQRWMGSVPILSGLIRFAAEADHRLGNLLMYIPGLAQLLKDEIPPEQAGAASAASVLVPLGISYYSFSLISYLADVYWKKDRAEKSFFRLLAFTLYFPKILQGPISRHRELAPQLFEGHAFDYTRFCFGLQRMVWGYFKKLVIADRLAIFVNTVFGDIAAETGAHLLVATVFSALQLYCDFSGCMDIACGFSECLGLKLAENFDHPFFSKSAAEFWRRWHITLGTWFKDYIYMPLAISPKLLGVSKKLRDRFGARASRAFISVVPLLAVWLLTGLWHGTGWNYVVWGLYWGVLIICSTVFAQEYKKLAELLHINTEAWSWQIFRMVRTFCLFLISRIITAPGDLAKSGLIFNRILTAFHPEGFFDGSLYTLGLDRPDFLFALVSIFILWAVSMLQEKVNLREQIAGSNLVFRWAIYYLVIFSVIIFGIYGPGYDAASFVYMHF